MESDLADLPQLLDDNEFEGVGSIVGMNADPGAGSLRLLLRVSSYDGTDERRAIECRSAVRWVLTDDPVYSISLCDDHPALLPFTDDQAELYFTGAPPDPARMAEALRATSARVAGPYLDFDAAINSAAGDLPKLLEGDHGKLASGPMTLLHAFQKLLEGVGVKTSLLSTGEPKIYVERELEWLPVPRQLNVLDLGESWIVAQTFHCRAA